MHLEENEIRVLNEFRFLGEASKADVVRRIGLTHPAVTRIVQKLCASGFLKQAEEKRKGPRGQPAAIYRISETNVFIGIHVGRRRLEFVALELAGNILAQASHAFGFLDQEKLRSLSRTELNRFLSGAELEARHVVGFGISTPFFWEGWQAILPANGGTDRSWTSDVVTELFDFPDQTSVYVENDGSSAALAELTFGTGARHSDFLFVNLGTFIGGGLVIDGTLRTGAHGNTGAIGPFPVAPSTLAPSSNSDQLYGQLLGRASLFALHEHARRNGITVDLSQDDSLSNEIHARVLAEWVDDCSSALAQFCVGVWSLIDIEAIVMDGPLPKTILHEVIAATRSKLRALQVDGIIMCDIWPGEFGAKAQSIGAACLPMLHILGPPPLKHASE